MLALLAAGSFVTLTLFLPAYMGGPESWGEFGNYFGGVAGPLVALLAVWFIYRTLKISQEQQRILEQQLAHERSKQQHVDLVARLDAALEAWNRCLDGTFVVLDEGTERLCLRDIFHTDSGWSAFRRRHEEKTADMAAALSRNAAELRRLLEEFGHYCGEHERLTGNRIASNFYRCRLEPVLERLVEVNLDETWHVKTLRAPKYLFPGGAGAGEMPYASLTTSLGAGSTVSEGTRIGHKPPAPG